MFMLRVIAVGALAAWSALRGPASFRATRGAASSCSRRSSASSVTALTASGGNARARSRQAHRPQLHPDRDGQPDVESRARHVGRDEAARTSRSRS